MTFATFDTWEEFMEHVQARRALYYQAPLDWQPVRVWARVLVNGSVQCGPLFHRDADPFVVDPSHLTRLRRCA
jgi:hypothetical protein